MATSGTAGNFTCAELVTITVAVDRIWADNTINVDYISYAEALRVIKERQTADLSALENAEKDEKIKVYFPVDCNTSIEDCDDDCDRSGPELEARCKEYELDLCKQAKFTVKEKMFRKSNLSREEVVARGLAKRLKELDEYLAQSTVAALNSFAGTNFFPGEGTVGGDGTTYLEPSMWTPDLTGYFIQVMMMNKLSGAYMLHGNNLWRHQWTASMNNLNQDQKDQLAKMNAIQQYWDPFNVDSVNTPDKVSYMITPGAMAFASKAYYPQNSPIEYHDDTRWSIQSKALPGVWYDVIYTNRCVNNDIIHYFALQVHAGIFQNPFGCEQGRTGILKFVCGTADES